MNFAPTSPLPSFIPLTPAAGVPMLRISKPCPRLSGGIPNRIRSTSMGLAARSFAQVVQAQKHARQPAKPKQEGTIAEFFENLDGQSPPFPARFADLKKEMCPDPAAMEHAWRAVLKELEDGTEEIAQRGSEVSASFNGLGVV